MRLDLIDISPDAITPVLIVVIGAFVALLVGVFTRRRAVDATVGVSVVTLVLAGLSSWSLWPEDGSQPLAAFNDALAIDGFSLLLGLVFLVGSLFAILMSLGYLRERPRRAGEFCALILMATSGMMVMAMAKDLIVAFLALEVLSIPLYILAGFSVSDDRSNEAALKYLLLGAFASGFLLFGIGLLFGACNTTRLAGLLESPQVQTGFEWMVPLGIGLVVVGLGFKAAFAPFHLWVPDVYQGAPTPVTAFMAAGPKAAAFALLFRIVVQTYGMSPELWHNVLFAMAIATMTLANLAALKQTEAKRLLAYSSIAHAGYLLVGVLAGAFDRRAAAGAIVFYLAIYALMKLGAFAVVVLMQRQHEGDTELSAFRGLARRSPGLAAGMGLLMFSLAGIPPLAGFWAKLILFNTAVNAGLISLAVIAVLNSVVAAYYYLRIVVLMYMEAPEEERVPAPGQPGVLVTAWAMALASLLLGILPGALIELARRAGNSIR